MYPKIVEAIKQSLYVDDVIIGAFEIAENLKATSIKIFKYGGWDLHKWHSNVPELENQRKTKDDDVAATYTRNKNSEATTRRRC